MAPQPRRSDYVWLAAETGLDQSRAGSSAVLHAVRAPQGVQTLPQWGCALPNPAATSPRQESVELAVLKDEAGHRVLCQLQQHLGDTSEHGGAGGAVGLTNSPTTPGG